METKNEIQLKAVKSMVLSLSYANHYFFTYGMKLAMERELADLKGIVKPETNTGSEFTILESLDDEVIKLILDAIVLSDELIRQLLKQNNLKKHLVVEDDECQELASELYADIRYDLEPDTYNEILIELDVFFYQMILILYLLYRIYIDDPIDLEEGDNYRRLQDEFHDPQYVRSIKIEGEDANLSMVFEFILKINLIRVEAGSWIK